MAFASSSTTQPLSEINTTPLVDVLLVLLIMFVLTMPAATHSVEVPLPGEKPVAHRPDPVKNKLVLTRESDILWNGREVSQGQLVTLLRATKRFAVEPELQVQPEADAPYDFTAKVLNVVKARGVTRLGFVGTDRFRTFQREGDR